MKKTIRIFLISVLLIFTNNLIYAESYFFNLKNNFESSICTSADPTFNFQSEAQILMELSTGKILYRNNENEKLLPASTTKLMTLLLLMEQIDGGGISYQDRITCSKNASNMGGSQIWFKEGESLTIDEALKAICVVSANDVTVAVAEFLGGSEDNFVTMMNAKAKELGMENTHYANSHGIDEEGHYTSVKDMAILAREIVSKHPDILKYTSIWMDTLRDGTFELSSTNKLIRYYDGATGLKTGYTSNSLYNLVGTATRGDTTLISVIFKAPTSAIRLEETKQLLDYGFLNYETKKVCSSNTVLEEIPVEKNVEEKLQTRIKEDVYILNNKKEKIEYENIVEYNEKLSAPIVKDEVVGKVKIIDKDTNELLGESDIIANNDFEKSNIVKYIKFIMNRFLLNC